MLPDIDYEAVTAQLQKENEQLRIYIVKLRNSKLLDVAYYWSRGMALMADPRYQLVLISVSMLVFALLRECLILFMRRKRRER